MYSGCQSSGKSPASQRKARNGEIKEITLRSPTLKKRAFGATAGSRNYSAKGKSFLTANSNEIGLFSVMRVR